MSSINPAGAAATQKGGTITTPDGPITWTLSPSGTVQAQGGGQELDSSGTNAGDGSSTRHTEYSLVGKPPYLTIDFAVDNTKRQVQAALKSDESQLSLTITNINATVTSGTALVSGSLHGSAVNWQGPVDLSSNPLVAGAIPGWPKGAFAAEIQNATLFAPVVNIVAPPSPLPQAAGGADPKHAFSAVGVLGQAGAWCLSGAIGASTAGPGTLGASMAVGCVGGFTASLVSSWISALDVDTVEPDTNVPLPDLNVTEQIGPVVTETQDDPPPPAPSGSTDPGADGDDDDDGGGGSTGSGIDDTRNTKPQ